MNRINYDLLSQIAIFFLVILSATVFFGLTQGRNMWLFIVCYWGVLTVKNLIDFLGKFKLP